MRNVDKAIEAVLGKDLKDPLVKLMGAAQMNQTDVMFLFLVSKHGWYVASTTFWHCSVEQYYELLKEVS